MKRFVCYGCFTLLLLSATTTVAQQKKPLTHEAYDRWKEIEGQTLSDDGQWALFSVHPPKGDGELRVKHLSSNQNYTVPRGRRAQFAEDNRFVAFLIAPPYDSTRQAKLDEVPPPKRPKDALGLLDLTSGDVTEVNRVQSYKLPEDGTGWIAYHREPPRADSAASKEGEEPEGAPLVVRHLVNGQEWSYEDVTDYAFSENGRLLAFTVAGSTGGGIYAAQLDGDVPQMTTVHTSDHTYSQMALDDTGTQVAFLAGPDSTDVPHHENTLYHWSVGDDEPEALAQTGTPGLPENGLISEQAELSFSEGGTRVFFGTAPRPAPPVEKDSLLDEEKVEVDIWHWKDPYLQPMQKERKEERRKQTYKAVYVLEEDRAMQLATEDVPVVKVGRRGDADVALGITNRPYRREISWDWPPYYDAYLIDLDTGERHRVLRKIQDTPTLSPTARYLAWWDRHAQDWFAMPAEADASPVNLTEAVPHPVWNQRHDRPYPAGPYGAAGWTASDARFLIYDKHDIWAVDPAGEDAPRAITEETGRANDLQFRYVHLDPNDERSAAGSWPNFVGPPTAVSDTMLLSAFNVEAKADGFYRDRVTGSQPPSKLVMMDRAFSHPRKAEDTNTLLYTRESFQEFPDLWVADQSFSDPQKISTVNPQQEEYRWGTAELVEWTSLDGIPLQGILYKPEDFDPSKDYPMMVYFYERNSDHLHRHWAPAAHRSIINVTFYASRGYVVFVPDVVYKNGYPGESAMNAVMPGVTKLMDRGFVDEDNIGVQGHSWGGYQIAYLVTETNLFKAAEAGAPVSDMISAYGGIRWGSGMSRMFQYEETQSRIGGSLWEKPLRYMENSPIFFADKIETPLLMMHNDHDTAVPWYQGIELFVALRRLGKPAWLINYNDAPHWPTTLADKRDWTKRMQQFFDHYLKGAPAPVWLKEGVPAVEKGRTLGLEPVTTDPNQ